MKYKPFILFLCITLMVIPISCKSNRDKSKNPSNDDLDWNQAEMTEITGLLELGKDYQLCVISNWTSRSRVSYYIYGDLKEKLEKSTGKIAVLKGLVIKKEDENYWNKKILVKEIISITENQP